MNSETLTDIVAEYRRDYEDMKAKRLYLPTAEYLRRLLDRIEAAADRLREEWSSRLADAHEVAENFKNALTKALGTLAWLKSAESPAARGCGENGGGSSRKTESEAK